MKNKIILSLLSFFAMSAGFAQVGMGTNTPDASSVLELKSTDRGFLLPRLTNAETKAIASPAEGLMVYNTDLKCVVVVVDGSFSCVGNPVLTAPTAPAQTGSSFGGHFNGWTASGYNTGSAGNTTTNHNAGEPFSNNTLCASSEISISDCVGATVTGKSGIEYRIIEINGQCWMQDNLQEVPSNFPNPVGSFSTPAGSLAYWGFTGAHDSRTFGTVEPAVKAGYLYTWNAAMDNSTVERSRGACPQGFHIPSDCEIMYLEHGMGMSIADQGQLGWNRGHTPATGNVVAKLKAGTATPDFNNFNVGHLQGSTNKFITNNGGNLGMWSSTETVSTEAFYRYSNSSGNNNSIGLRIDGTKSAGFSVRCLKD